VIQKRGFTMIELMIVIAIIAILATIIMPKFTQARDRSKLQACKTNLRHVGVALEMYANENQRLYPATGSVSSSCILVTAGYLKRDARCPVTNNTYWITAAADNTYCNCACGASPSAHASMGIPDYYPRYDTRRGVLER